MSDALREGAELDQVQQEIAGIHLARGGDYAGAIELLAPTIDPESPGSSFLGFPSFLHGAHALAWAYPHIGAEDKAARLLATEARECTETLAEAHGRDSYDLHRCAETELLLGNVERALEGFEKAVAAGWREYYLRQNDPYWASVADHPRYRAAMAKAKADVDRQRAEVQRIDASEDFFSKFRAVIAAEKAEGRK